MTSERQLSEVLSEFARTMVTDFPIQAILDHLVERIVEIMPITAAGVTLISPGVEPRFVAASNDAALRYEQLQTDVSEGPCLAAYSTGQPVSVPDLRHDDRFPNFTPRALAAGLAAVFTFPLRHERSPLGALDLYRDTPGRMSPRTMTAAQTLADVAAAYLLIAQARAELQSYSVQLREAALHDALTGLPNRALMLERLDHAFRRGRRSGKALAVVFVDLDRFKLVNDTYGHRGGDELLIAVAQRLRGMLRPGDTLARLYGDEFAILCEDLDTPAQADLIVARIDAALASPYILSGVEVEMTASVGIAFADRGGSAPDQLLHNADTAMYQAKRKGGGRRQILDLREQHLARYQAGLQRDLHGAVERDEMHIDYQPIVETSEGNIVGAEALLRWDHPDLGSVPPAVVIPLAEESGMISGIGYWVLQQAWRQRHRWGGRHWAADFAISVNVSAPQLMSAGFADAVAALLSAASADAGLLTLEMTESVFARDAERALVVLNDLKDMGVNLALDDFGTGYSSLSYLMQFPVDVVKVDRSFVANLGREATSHTIVAAVVQLAHGLGMTVVAEGVETSRQHDELRRFGCDFCQGYYFAAPMSATDLDALLRPGVADHDPGPPGVAPTLPSLRAFR